jgi:hypothetical protein
MLWPLYHQGKCPLYPMDMGLGGLRADADVVAMRKILAIVGN